MSISMRPMLMILLALPGVMPGMAGADLFDDLEVHGFATQGYVKTSDNSYFGDSEDGSFDFRELGLNATFNPLPSVRVSGQLLSRLAGELSSGTPRVDFALADFTIASDEHKTVGLKIGRITSPIGFYNETRDVAFTRPGFVVPQVIYFDRVRDMLLSHDGAGLSLDLFSGPATANLYVGFGAPPVDRNVEYSFLLSDQAGEFESDPFDSYFGRLMVSSADERLRGAFSVVSSAIDYIPGAGDFLNRGSTEILYLLTSLEYQVGDLTFTAEYLREEINWDGFAGSPLEGARIDPEAYYLQAVWYPKGDIRFLFRYEEGFANRTNRSGDDTQIAPGVVIPAHTDYAKIWTAGIRWDASQDLMLLAEYQRHNGTFVTSTRENPDPGKLVPDWDMFALSVSYRF